MYVLGVALVGMLLGGAVTASVAVVAAMVMDISQAEGAYAMAVTFFWVPLGGLAGMIAAIALAPRR